ncbi:MAG TPA: LysM peptidoglycan-binding domain-containing protein, partial [Leptolinea sp.]
DGSVYHTVGYGQTLSTIAGIYQVDIKELIQLNQIEPDKIYSGQKLLIKTAGPLLPTDKSTSTISPILQSTPTLKPAVSSTSTTLPTPTTTPEPINTKEIGIITIYTLFGVLAIIILFISRGNRPPS